LPRLLLSAVALAGASVGLVSCGGPPASMSAQIKQWSIGAGFADLDRVLEADFPEVNAGIKSGNLKALKTACAGLAIDAGSIYNTLLTPDHALNTALASALSGLANAGNICNALQSDAPSATTSLRHILAGNEALYAKERRIIIAADGR
jgi:hypothetical protein